MPPELKNPENWTLFDFESVFAAFREDDGVRLGDVQQHDRPRLRADDPRHARQAASRPSQPGGKAFQQSALAQWEPEVIDPICDQLVDEFKDDGEADLVKAVTFEFPTRVTAALLGLPQEDLEMFRRLSLQPDLDHRGHRGRSDGVGRTGHLLPGAGGPAPQQDDRRHHRRSRRSRDRRREAHRRSDHLVPAVASARRAGDHLSVVEQPAAAAAHPSRPTRGGPAGSRPHSGRDRGRDSIRDPVGSGGAQHHPRCRDARHDDPGGRAGQPVHGFGQSRRNAVGPTPTCSTSIGRGARTSRSRAASTAASACTWPGSKRGRC